MRTITEIKEICEKNRRICPQPIKWNEFYEILPNKKSKGNVWEPSLPLILAAWWDTPLFLKKNRFLEHVEWANKHNILDQAYNFLSKLQDEDWFHF